MAAPQEQLEMGLANASLRAAAIPSAAGRLPTWQEHRLAEFTVASLHPREKVSIALYGP